jgi:adenylate cyclase
VNIAARLEKLAEPGSVVIARAVHDQVRGKVPYSFDDLGEQPLHNIAEPVTAYRMSPAASVRGTAKRRSGAPAEASVAVLPFENMSGDPAQDYFADGMVEDVITGLARIKWLFMIARNSTFTYKGQPVDVRRVGRELGVRYVLEGSVRKADKRVRISAQLVEAFPGRRTRRRGGRISSSASPAMIPSTAATAGTRLQEIRGTTP